MQQESGGEEQAVSPVGAIGLMQVMPDTYEGLRDSNGLGDDPFNPHDNILAGAAYIKEMYELYGSPGFLAAYNAGPGQMNDYLAGSSPLPNETVNYLAAITPNLGNEIPLSGPLAQYASASGGITPTVSGFATGCDVNAAYDPDHPCAAEAPPTEMASQAFAGQASTGACDADLAYDPDNPCSAVSSTPSGGIQSASAGSCDTDIAYDPANPCTAIPQTMPATVQTASAGGCDPDTAYDPSRPCAPEPVAIQANAQIAPPRPQITSALYQPAVTLPRQAAAIPSTPAMAVASQMTPQGNWAIQVGAFANPGLARAVAEGARAEAPGQLDAAAIALPTMAPFGGLVLYRAQLVHLSAATAIDACTSLNHRQLPCIVLPATGA